MAESLAQGAWYESGKKLYKMGMLVNFKSSYTLG